MLSFYLREMENGFLVIFALAKWDGCVNNRNVQSVKSAPFQMLYSSPSQCFCSRSPGQLICGTPRCTPGAPPT